MYINKAHIYGNLTRDPELKALPSGGKVASFSVATNRQYKKADGSKAEETEFHNVVVFGKTAEACAQFLRKGGTVYIGGRIKTRTWDAGEKGKQYRTEIIAEEVQFGPRREDGDMARKPAPQAAQPAAPAAPAAATSTGAFDYPEEEINPDDIPF